MAMDTYRCPNCGTLLRLPPQLEIARMQAASGGRFIGLVSSDTLPCSQCGHRIPIDDIMTSAPGTQSMGQRIAGGLKQAFGCLVAIAIGLFLIVFAGKCSGG